MRILPSAAHYTYVGTENDLQHSLSEMADGTIASGAVYSDAEGQRQNPELKMVLALMDLITKSDGRQSNAGGARETVEIHGRVTVLRSS
jgi:hypothetical protein